MSEIPDSPFPNSPNSPNSDREPWTQNHLHSMTNKVTPHRVAPPPPKSTDNNGVPDSPCPNTPNSDENSNIAINASGKPLSPTPLLPARNNVTLDTAAPPPKAKRFKKKAPHPPQEESVVYAVPTTHWFSRRNKSQPKTTYKELDLNKRDAPNQYTTPST